MIRFLHPPSFGKFVEATLWIIRQSVMASASSLPPHLLSPLLPLSPVWIILQLIIFHISIPPSAHTDLSLKLSCVIWSRHSAPGLECGGPMACLLRCDWRCHAE